jgi:putative oxidoreductase
LQFPYDPAGGKLQRLYSTFADRWPGVGLLLQRVVAAIMLVCFCVIHLTDSSLSMSMIPQIIGACTGMFFLVGLWTPIVGSLIAVVELWIALTHVGNPWISILLATIGATSAMLGPGAFSVDARLFGRRHLEVQKTNTSSHPSKE